MAGAIIIQHAPEQGKTMNALSGEQLALAIAERDVEALREAYRRYGPAIEAMAARMTASSDERREIVRESFLALWRHATSFDGTRTRFSSWFVTMAHRRAVLRLRRHGAGTGRTAAAAAAPAGGKGPAATLESQPRPVRSGDGQGLADPPPPPDRSGTGQDEPFDEQARDLVSEAFFGALTHVDLARRSGLPGDLVRNLLRSGLIQLAGASTVEQR
jgi:RNA polymerase sigma-70 factor (ECF subfamily)